MQTFRAFVLPLMLDVQSRRRRVEHHSITVIQRLEFCLVCSGTILTGTRPAMQRRRFSALFLRQVAPPKLS
jgi:hypothetical protein